MAFRLRQLSRSRSAADVQAFARRMARVERITRGVCTVLGFALGCVAVAFLVFVGWRFAWNAAALGAFFIGVAACGLLRRGLAGRDIDRFDADAVRDYNIRFRP